MLQLPLLGGLLGGETLDLVLKQGGSVVQIEPTEDLGDLIRKALEPALAAVGAGGLLEVAVDDRVTLDRAGPFFQTLQHRPEERFQPLLLAGAAQETECKSLHFIGFEDPTGRSR